MFGRATIRLGIGPHSSFQWFVYHIGAITMVTVQHYHDVATSKLTMVYHSAAS